MINGEPITILLVEDDPAHAEIVLRNLADFRVANRIIHVEDGQAALDYLFRQAAYADPQTSPRPAIILLDLRLPKVDGLEVLRRIKEDTELKRIPTVVLTTSNAEADMVGAYTNGAGSYLVKPVDFEKFTKLMEAFGFYWLAWNRFLTEHGKETRGMDTALHILLVEDEPAHAEAIRRAFQAADPSVEVRVLATLREYRELVAARPPHIAIMDLNLPDGRAVDVLVSPPETGLFPIVVTTSYGNEHIAVEAMRAGALDYVVKSPEAFAGMPHTVERTLREWRLLQEHKRAGETLERGRTELKAIYENAPVMMCVLDADRQVLYANRAFVEFAGKPEYELKGTRVGGVLGCINALDDSRGCGFGQECESCSLRLAAEDTLKTGTSHRAVERQITTVCNGDRREVVLLGSTAVIQVAGKTELLLCLENITERKRAEQALRASEIKYRRLHESISDAYTSVDMTGRILEFNKAYRDMLGYSDEELRRLTYQELTPEEWHALEARIVEEQVVPLGHSEVYQKEYRRKDGAVFPVELRTYLIRDDAGQPTGMWAIIRDITGRKLAETQNELLGRLATRLAACSVIEQMVSAVEEETRQLLTWDSHYFAVRSPDGHAFRILHFVDTIDGQKRLFTPDPDHLLHLGPAVQRVVEGEPVLINRTPDQLEPVFERFGDGDRLSASLMFAPVRSGTDVIGILSAQSYTHSRYGETDLRLLQRVADLVAPALRRAYAEEALKESELFNREIIDQAGEGVIVYDRELRYLAWNPFMEKLTGLRTADVLGRSALELFPHVREQGIDRLLERALAGETVVSPETPFTCPTTGASGWFVGTYAPHCKADGSIVGAISTVHDVTERRQAGEQQAALEEQLRQVQKLDAMGRMAATIAHDFRNLLMVMGGHAELALTRLDPGHEARNDIQGLQRAMAEASAVINSLLTFSRKQTSEKEPVSVGECLSEAQPLLRQAVSKRVEIHVDIQCDSPCYVLANKGLLHQVLLNLALNASDAMPQGGRLLLNAAPATESEVRDCFGAADPGQQFVQLSVTDSGEGIPPEIQDRIFDPFFTTKKRGQGTGLGLSIVYGIIEELAGWIRVRSEVGKGTTFTILLPLAPIEDVPTHVQLPPRIQRGCGEEILIAGGEAYMRGAIAWSLESLGYRVTVASRMEEVLEASRRPEGRIRVIVLDEVLADGDGFQCEQTIRRENAELPVIMTSRSHRDDDTLADRTLLLCETFSFTTLAAMLRNVIAPANEETDEHD